MNKETIDDAKDFCKSLGLVALGLLIWAHLTGRFPTKDNVLMQKTEQIRNQTDSIKADTIKIARQHKR